MTRTCRRSDILFLGPQKTGHGLSPVAFNDHDSRNHDWPGDELKFVRSVAHSVTFAAYTTVECRMIE
jgi:hypothetical protein